MNSLTSTNKLKQKNQRQVKLVLLTLLFSIKRQTTINQIYSRSRYMRKRYEMVKDSFFIILVYLYKS